MNTNALLRLNSLAVITALAGMSLYTAHGQNITWGSATTITGDANLIDAANTPGAVNVDAILPNGNYNSPIGSNHGGSANASPTPLTADGVTFNAPTPTATSISDGTISLTASSGSFNSYGNNTLFPASGSASAAFAAVLNAGGLYGSGPGIITIAASALTAGDVYDLQILNYSAVGGSESTTFTSGSSSVTLADEIGQYATGVFTATGAAETINFANASGPYTPVIGGINLVNVSDVAPTPEPSTFGLMALGAVAVAGIYRRQRQTA